jgi:predicted nucleic acid-binding protein
LLVIDAAAAVTACLSEAGLGGYEDRHLVAPPLLWSESTSVLHQLRWRKEISVELAGIAFGRLLAAPIAFRHPRGLHEEAWRLADQLGWAKTCDAEYLALARLLRCPLMTTDAKLKRSAGRLVDVVGPDE